MKQYRTDANIKTQIDQAKQQESVSRAGIVGGYDSINHTCTVLLTATNSEQIVDILENVPCPLVMGIQTVAPEIGKWCWVVFTGQDEKSAVISHFYNHYYKKYDHSVQTRADNPLPSFMLNG